MSRWVDGWMARPVYGWMDGWRYGWVNGWVDVWIDKQKFFLLKPKVLGEQNSMD